MHPTLLITLYSLLFPAAARRLVVAIDLDRFDVDGDVRVAAEVLFEAVFQFHGVGVSFEQGGGAGHTEVHLDGIAVAHFSGA